MPTPVVVRKIEFCFFQRIWMVQSEKSEMSAAAADMPETPMIMGWISSITPQGI